MKLRAHLAILVLVTVIQLTCAPAPSSRAPSDSAAAPATAPEPGRTLVAAVALEPPDLAVRGLRERPTSLFRFRGATAQDFRDDLVRHQVRRDSHDVQGSERTAAHRVNVGDRIGCRDLAIAKRIVHDGGKEIHRLDKGAITS